MTGLANRIYSRSIGEPSALSPSPHSYSYERLDAGFNPMVGYMPDAEGLAPMTDAAAEELRLSRGRARSLSSFSLMPGLAPPTTFITSRPLPQGYQLTRTAPPPAMTTRYDDDVSEDSFEEEEDEDVPMPPLPNDALPVVPAERLRGQTRRLLWEQHPAHGIVLSLLTRRGVVPQLHRTLVEYHMAEAFLNCLSALMRGSYFVRYAPKNASPKERFFNVQMLPDSNRRLSPFLCWYIHRTAVQMIDKVSLDDLVGVSPGFQSPAFRRWLISHDIIKGCMQGHHRARMSTRGCFTLWFYDRVGQRPRSVDLLTNNMSIFQVWTKTMEGILTVNSSSPNGSTDAGQEMQRLLRLVQQKARSGELEDESGAFAAQVADQ
jgi:hypothetical protein